MERKEHEQMIEEARKKIAEIEMKFPQFIVGQKEMLDILLITLLAGGIGSKFNSHILLKGKIGSGKTEACKTLAAFISGEFRRDTFTPDMRPQDLLIKYDQDKKTGIWHEYPGPVFANIFLGDELNRAPEKVQDALLEATQERQVSVGGETRLLPELFMFLATINPTEEKIGRGTFPIIPTLMDRMTFEINIGYPSEEEEIAIVKRHRFSEEREPEPIVTVDEILKMRKLIENEIHLEDALLQYAVRIVRGTRLQKEVQDFLEDIEEGGGVRPSIWLTRTARARAFLNKRDYVLPEDIEKLALPILRHRIILKLGRDPEDADEIIKQIIQRVIEDESQGFY